MGDTNSSKTKDAMAFSLLYGGTAIVQAGMVAAIVGSSLVAKGSARSISKMMSKASSAQKSKAWGVYKKTGSISEMIGTMLE